MTDIKIVTVPSKDGSTASVQGTKILVGGHAIPMVTRIELIAEPGGYWVARVDIHVDPATVFTNEGS